jgi:C-terminal processing protease CtpA/Prc
MLEVIGDSATKVVTVDSSETIGKPLTPKEPVELWTQEKDIVGLQINVHERGAADLRAGLAKVQSRVSESNKLIIDLRAASGAEAARRADYVDSIPEFLVGEEVILPSSRYVSHSGYMSMDTARSDYFSSVVMRPRERISPGKARKSKRLAVLVNAESILPSVVIALIHSGRALVIAEGPVTEAIAGVSESMDLGEGLRATIRIREFSNGWRLRLNAQVPGRAKQGWGSPAVKEAVRLLRMQVVTPDRIGADSAGVGRASEPFWRPDQQYESMVFPSPEYRLLALFRFWNVIKLFYPYFDLLDAEWDAILAEFIQRFDANRDSKEYVLTLAELAARVPDNHMLLVGGHVEWPSYFGKAVPGVAIRLIDEKPVVVRVLDSKTSNAGVKAGDVVTHIDGVPVEVLQQSVVKYFGAASPAGRALRIERNLLRGNEGTSVGLRLKDTDRSRDIFLERRNEYSAAAQRVGEVVKILPPNIGYVDLDRLEQPEVDGMFEQIKDTRALIFDLRGRARSTVWTIAPRLISKERLGAVTETPLVSAVESRLMLKSEQMITPSGQWRYRGETVALIDEHAVSHAEHTGLLLEAANGTKFVGSPTAGTNGGTTWMVVPGGIRIKFTGQAIKHWDGRQLQRIGLIPDVGITPTIQGIREGRDEVLECAIEAILKGKLARPVHSP